MMANQRVHVRLMTSLLLMFFLVDASAANWGDIDSDIYGHPSGGSWFGDLLGSLIIYVGSAIWVFVAFTNDALKKNHPLGYWWILLGPFVVALIVSDFIGWGSINIFIGAFAVFMTFSFFDFSPPKKEKKYHIYEDGSPLPPNAPKSKPAELKISNLVLEDSLDEISRGLMRKYDISTSDNKSFSHHGFVFGSLKGALKFAGATTSEIESVEKSVG